MPQMAPYNWLFLFIMFNLIFITSNSYINTIYIKNMKKSFKNATKIFYKWKW